MARVPLLDEDDGHKAKSSSGWGSVSWTHRLMAQMAGKDELTYAICRVTEAAGPSPKDKYLSYIVSLCDQDPNIIEEVLLRLSAMTDWSEHGGITCKALLVVHNLLQRLDRYYNKHQSAVIFLNEIKDFWQRKDNFLESYALSLLHRILMDVDCPALSTSIYEKQSLLAINPHQVLRGYNISDVTLFLTNLLSYLERLTQLVTAGSYNMHSSNSSLTSSDKQIYSYAKSYIQSESLALVSTAGYILTYLQGVGEGSVTSIPALYAQLDVLRGTMRLTPLSQSSSSSTQFQSSKSPYQWN